MNADTAIRKQLVKLLTGEEAHMTFEQAVADFPVEHYNTKPPHVSYTPWHLLEHVRITQRDILDFINVKGYKELKWPDDYWPAKTARANKAKWNKTIMDFITDNKALQQIILDSKRDLFALLSWGEPYTIFRQIVVVGNHNSYHVGEFASLREVMKTWPKKR